MLVGEGEPSIDNWTFQLYYKVTHLPHLLHSQVTSAILLTSAILISLNQFFGDPIQCDLVRPRPSDHAADGRGEPGHPEELLLDVLHRHHTK